MIFDFFGPVFPQWILHVVLFLRMDIVSPWQHLLLRAAGRGCDRKSVSSERDRLEILFSYFDLFSVQSLVGRALLLRAESYAHFHSFRPERLADGIQLINFRSRDRTPFSLFSTDVPWLFQKRKTFLEWSGVRTSSCRGFLYRSLCELLDCT